MSAESHAARYTLYNDIVGCPICGDCGAFVRDCYAHDRFHDRLDDLAELVVRSIP